MNGAPTYQYVLTKSAVADVWNNIVVALNKNLNVGVDTPSTSLFGLVTSHSHSLLGAYQLKDSTGKVIHNLYRVRDPHGNDLGYNGNWNDKYSGWTDAFKAQVPFINNQNDGIFFIEDFDFMKGFITYNLN